MDIDARSWFEGRTHRYQHFSVEGLVARKAETGVTVSVVVPCRNEVGTIAENIEAVASLAGEGGLVDELVVLDGSSTDGTAERAAATGVPVYDDSQVLPDFGKSLGKGDALWRGLAVTSGDIVAYCDSDIRKPDPRYVWGLLGPLLDDPGIQLVKGFYDRPFAQDWTSGGRVTELMARPLLNMFWPELTGIVQPLGGEYAGRRQLFESIPFFTGYGVELGMLLDTVSAVGVDAIAQVDLVERVHTNQPLAALSRMAFAIGQVAARRLTDEGRMRAGSAGRTDYMQFSRLDGRMVPQVCPVEVVERPPLRSLREG
ncbi:MAG: glucosyl-3-phosphoglycerate synthase [Actinomycetota bacterium]|nr:glucosyl-3-phosphoglycerate synthase [Actinomycetota bacterium]